MELCCNWKNIFDSWSNLHLMVGAVKSARTHRKCQQEEWSKFWVILYTKMTVFYHISVILYPTLKCPPRPPSINLQVDKVSRRFLSTNSNIRRGERGAIRASLSFSECDHLCKIFLIYSFSSDWWVLEVFEFMGKDWRAVINFVNLFHISNIYNSSLDKGNFEFAEKWLIVDQIY